MKRNIILMGGKTHVISLPSAWIKKYKIKKGDEINLEEEDSRIIITTANIPEKEPIKINLENANSSVIVRTITTCYQMGYPELELVISKKTINEKNKQEIPTLNIIQDACDQLIGFEIIEQKETYCRIKDVVGGSINEFNNILRRIFLMINTFGEETLRNLNNFSELETLHRQHITIRKHCHYCQRYLNIKGYKNKTTIYNELIVRLLEISHVYRFITKNQLEKRNEYNSEIVQILKNIISLQNDYYVLFYSSSNEKINELIEKRIEIFQKINYQSQKESGENLIFLHRLPPILNNILSMTNMLLAINFEE